jgi:hypothetical protein
LYALFLFCFFARECRFRRHPRRAITTTICVRGLLERATYILEQVARHDTFSSTGLFEWLLLLLLPERFENASQHRVVKHTTHPFFVTSAH